MKNLYTKKDIQNMLEELDDMLETKSKNVLEKLHGNIREAFNEAKKELEKIPDSEIIKLEDEDEKHDYR